MGDSILLHGRLEGVWRKMDIGSSLEIEMWSEKQSLNTLCDKFILGETCIFCKSGLLDM